MKRNELPKVIYNELPKVIYIDINDLPKAKNTAFKAINIKEPNNKIGVI